jgi:hypothetical protein
MTPSALPMLSHQHQQPPLQQYRTSYCAVCQPQPEFAAWPEDPLVSSAMPLPLPDACWTWESPLAAEVLDAQDLALSAHFSRLPSFTDAEACIYACLQHHHVFAGCSAMGARCI